MSFGLSVQKETRMGSTGMVCKSMTMTEIKAKAKGGHRAGQTEEGRSDPRDPGCRRVYALLRAVQGQLPLDAVLLADRLLQSEGVGRRGRRVRRGDGEPDWTSLFLSFYREFR